MKTVWIGYFVSDRPLDYGEIKYVEKIFDDEAKAIAWKNDFHANAFQWREIEQFLVT